MSIMSEGKERQHDAKSHDRTDTEIDQEENSNDINSKGKEKQDNEDLVTYNSTRSNKRTRNDAGLSSSSYDSSSEYNNRKRKHRKRKHKSHKSKKSKKMKKDDTPSCSENSSDSDDSEESDNDDDDDDNNNNRKRKHHKKSSKSNKKRKKEEKKAHKKSSKKSKEKRKKRKRSHKYSDDEEEDDDDSAESSEKMPKRHKNGSEHTNKNNEGIDTTASFGKYGILKATDYNRMQHTFQIWMAEVKGIHSFTGPKWELQKYFDDYREDYNTGTLPHIKYYNYEKWEMEEYNKQKQEAMTAVANAGSTGTGTTAAKSDEYIHRQEQIRQRQLKQQNDTLQILNTMNKEKVQDMKHQAELRAQMQIAFKTGDKATYRRLKEKLEADV